ncbi:TIGR04282 family arsenosugar biosynthesis glycosyltransferase [Methylocaldum marinum]|nr:TIGR04282 family arsenosugar biosynthesis glycosyltransferase [Methylocaldum marinum]
MAKAPIPGQVKTRLIPALGAEGASRLHAALLRRTVGAMLHANLCPIQLWCSPDTDHPEFIELQVLGTVLKTQCPGDLGARMGHAARECLETARKVIIIGTDCPVLHAGFVEQAIITLTNGHDAIVGPAEDGGYYLLGLNRTADELFQSMPWGGERVLLETRRRLDNLGWRWSELAPLWDVDRPEDLQRLESVNL